MSFCFLFRPFYSTTKYSATLVIKYCSHCHNSQTLSIIYWHLVYWHEGHCPNNYYLLYHTNQVLNQVFSRRDRWAMSHAPFLVSKHVATFLETTFPKEIHQTLSHRFRHQSDLQFEMFHAYAAESKGRAQITRTSGESHLIKLDGRVSQLVELRRILNDRTYWFVCVNDDLDQPNDKYFYSLNKIMESRFPNPSPWEIK